MNGKTIGIWIVVILIVLAGGYFIFTKSSGSAAPAAQQQQQQQPTGQTQTASTTSDQVQGQDVSVGTGAVAQPNMQVSVLYVGKLQDGTVFDSSAAHGNTPLQFVLGTNGLIPGFQIGVNGMKEGGERLLAIPPALGYGTQDVKDPKTGKVIIPANSTLIFDVKLVKVSPAPAGSTAPTPTKTK